MTIAETPPQPDVHYLAPFCTEDDMHDRRLDRIKDFPLGLAIATATEILYLLTGREFRSGRSIVRPTSIQGAYASQPSLYPYSSMSGYGAAWGFAAGWAWTGVGMGWWQSGQDLTEVRLMAPITRINSIMVDGLDLGPCSRGTPNQNYTVYDRRRVIRNVTSVGSGSESAGAWPWNQQLQLDISQPGTWQIDYEWGRSAGNGGRMACAALATEIALAASGDKECTLSSRVQTIAVQGVTVGIGDNLEYLTHDFTGLPLVDLWIQAVNPSGRRRRAVILSPNSQQLREQW